VWNRIATGLGHYNIFLQATFSLTGASKKPQLSAGVWPACQTLIAFPARHGWFYGYAISRFNTGNLFSDFHYRSCTFMPYRKRITDDLAADSSCGIIMNIGTANPHYIHSYLDLLSAQHLGSGTSIICIRRIPVSIIAFIVNTYKNYYVSKSTLLS